MGTIALYTPAKNWEAIAILEKRPIIITQKDRRTDGWNDGQFIGLTSKVGGSKKRISCAFHYEYIETIDNVIDNEECKYF